MKTNELMLNNIVTVKTALYRVTTITRTGDVFLSLLRSGKYTVYQAKEISGVLLTEKWLTDFGFEKAFSSGFKHLDCDWRYSKGKLNLRIYKDEDGETDWDDLPAIGYKDLFTDTTIKYVHQLQNLYFALTGEELELKK